MPYTLQAFISKAENPNLLVMEISYVVLEQGFILVPVNKAFRKRFEIGMLPLLEKTDRYLHPIFSFGCSASENIKVAYIEAEFFGGVGMQASLMFENGKRISSPRISVNAIDLALQFLGVSKLSFSDEIDALSLGRYRDTEKWPAIVV